MTKYIKCGSKNPTTRVVDSWSYRKVIDEGSRYVVMFLEPTWRANAKRRDDREGSKQTFKAPVNRTVSYMKAYYPREFVYDEGVMYMTELGPSLHCRRALRSNVKVSRSTVNDL